MKLKENGMKTNFLSVVSYIKSKFVLVYLHEEKKSFNNVELKIPLNPKDVLLL